MGTELEKTGADRPIVYDVTKGQIAELKLKYGALKYADDPEVGRVALADLRGRRTAIEKRRVALKAEALEYGRQVDKVAKELTAAIAEIEDPLHAQKVAIDQAEARAKFERENAERLAREEAERAARAAEDARKAQELEDQRKALDAQKRAQDAEEDRLMAIEAEHRVKREREEADLRRQREEIAAAQRTLDEANRRAETERKAREQAETDRAAAEKVEKERLAKVERDRVEAAAAEERRLAEEAAALAKAQALKPDRERLAALAGDLRAWFDAHAPENLTTPEAGEALDRAQADIEDIAKRLEAFGA